MENRDKERLIELLAEYYPEAPDTLKHSIGVIRYRLEDEIEGAV